MMTNDMGDTAKLSLFVAEARTMGIEVLGPDVNGKSHVAFVPPAGRATVPEMASRPHLMAGLRIPR